MRPHSRVVTVILAALLSVGALTAPAMAASPGLVSAAPAAGAAIKAKPNSVTLTFNQAVAASSTISVAGPAGSSSCLKNSAAASTTLVCDFQGFPTTTLPDGSYTVSYSAASTGADRATTGSYAFTLDTVDPVAPTGLTFTPSDYLATSNGLVVSGASEKATDSVTVTLSSGTSVSRTVAAGASGAFSASFTSAQVRALDDGTITASVTSSDLAGNASPAATKTALKDISKPALVSTNPAAGGGANSAGFTYSAVASEALGVSSAVRLLDAANNQIAVTNDVSGSTLTATPTRTIPAGSYRAQIQLVDERGNQGDLVERTFTVDDSAPAAPIITTPVAVITEANVTGVPFAGTGEVGATVALVVSTVGTVGASTVSARAIVDSAGRWSVTVDATPLADGAVDLSAAQSDSAGNLSAASTATTTKDTAAPRVTGQGAAPSTITSGNTIATVTGTVDNGTTSDGEATSVRVSVDDSNAATAPRVATGTSSSAGAFSLAVDVAALSDGTLTYTIVATDEAGNASTAVTTTTAKSTANPTAPTVVITPKPINNANKGSIVVSGTATGANVDVSLGDGTTVLPTQNVAISSGRYTATFNSTTLADGTIAARAVAIDGVGNRSPVGLATTTKDVVAPAAPTGLTAPAFISTATVAVSGSAEPGSTVTVVATDSALLVPRTATGSVVVPASGAWTVTLTVSTFAEGTVTFSASASDAVGNKGTAATITRTKDTTAPGQPATLTSSPTTYTSASTTFRVSGTTASADTAATGLTADITVSDADASTADLVAPGVVVTSSAFATDFTVAQMRNLADGALTLSAVVRDPAGNAGTARTASAAKNTVALRLVSTTPAAGSSVKTAATVSATYSEVLATGSTLVVTNKSGVTIAGSKAVSDKTITFTPSSALAEAGSPFTVTLKGIDSADASDTQDTTSTFTLDATVPAVPAIVSVTDPINADNQKAVVVTGTSGEPGLDITVTIGSVTGTATSGTDGAWTASSIDVTSLADGTVSVTAKAADAADNTSAAGPATTTVKETIRPTVTSVTPSNGSTVRPPATVQFTFSEALATGTVTIPGAAGSSAVVGSTVTFTPTGPVPDGVRTATASVTDARGNSATGATTFTVDGTGPIITGLAGTDASTTSPQSSITGTRSEASSVALTATDGTRTVTGTVASGIGAFSATLDLSTLTPGEVTVTARATDALGNVGGLATTTLAYSRVRAATSTTLTAPAAQIVRGESITLRGRVERRTTTVAAVAARIRAVTSDGTVVDLGTVPVAANGTFRKTLKPAVNATYTVTYPGDSHNLPSTSPSRRTKVAATVTGRSARGPASKRATIVGQVTPAVSGTTITVYRVSGDRRVKLGTTTVTGKRYRFTTAKLPRGASTIEVRVGATADNAAGSVRFKARRS